MKLRAKSTKDNSAIDVSFTVSRITQQGVFAGDNFFDKDLFTFDLLTPFSVPTEAEMEMLEFKVAKDRPTRGSCVFELWELVK